MGSPGFWPLGSPESRRTPRSCYSSACLTCLSFLYMDSQRRTCRSRPASALGQLSRRARVEQDDDAVLIALIEQFGSVHHTIARRRAGILVDSHFHPHTRHSYGVTGANHRPTIASM